jgi:hypothetical protein
MQQAEKRKSLRRSVTYPAFVDLGDGSPPRECMLCDASQDGAQLAVADPNSLPNEFILALSFDGAARRRCRVIRRTETEIGVEFLKDHKTKKATRTTPAWMMRPSAPSPAPGVPIPAPGDAPQATEAQAESADDSFDIDALSKG